MLVWGRLLRNARELVNYPIWLLSGQLAPDNHTFKRNRVKSVAARFQCETFIETGTFYGQMTSAVRDKFKKILSVELLESLYRLNKESFAAYSHIHLYCGDSASELRQMLGNATGRILFWLDGHYSGAGTARGNQVSPILEELDQIRTHSRNDHCILIDDARLFDGTGGYPTLEQAKEKLLSINPVYQISLDHDCLVALPKNGDFSIG
jgi:hypothetical protein